jgi:hypothetical protein
MGRSEAHPCQRTPEGQAEGESELPACKLQRASRSLQREECVPCI